ncbi:MAG: periplasmic protein cpxP [Bdellovibrio sp. ArHS]|uniref:Spy/CpxP family protein refolding chaperone n=1 Tax=Bdellovibrio sp. ArHS TaxID=1569284 RepID=UPI000582D378|nr:Spy/CpxP family protein refolding chaperone [Bdellovibrio sp. ArHS]KHD87200.1 MAG: periplasmic protein cpxP [Bdellovibrio sp. ArHS]
MKFNQFLASVMVLTMISTTALARSPGREARHKGDEILPMEKHFNPEKMKELGLTDEQSAKLKSLRESKKAEFEKLREEMKEARHKFKQMIRSNASREEVQKAFQLMFAKKEQLAQGRLQSILDARDLLTEEQKVKLFSQGK